MLPTPSAAAIPTATVISRNTSYGEPETFQMFSLSAPSTLNQGRNVKMKSRTAATPAIICP
jgi:hypothetical protein